MLVQASDTTKRAREVRWRIGTWSEDATSGIEGIVRSDSPTRVGMKVFVRRQDEVGILKDARNFGARKRQC